MRSVLYNLKSPFHGVWGGLAKYIKTSCTVSSLRRNLRFQFVSRFTMAHVPVIPAEADVVAAVDPPVPTPVVPPVVVPAPVAPVQAAPVVAPLAAPAPAQDPGPAPIQAVAETADAQPVSVLSSCVCIFSLASCFAFCRLLTRARRFVTFTSELVCAVYGSFFSKCVFAVLCSSFHERICFRCFIVLSRANMFTLFLCYFCQANVFALFMVLSQANMFMLFLVLSRANMFTLFYVIFLKRMCLRCLWYLHERMSPRFLCYFFSSECVYAVYGTFTSEYVYYVFFFSSRCVYGGLYVTFS